jgi:hypothetical protein
MKERAILFSAPMVRALLAGTKTQTRRAVKLPRTRESFVLEDHGDGWWPYQSDDDESSLCDDGNEHPYNCPYGQPGDCLWVREAFRLADGYRNLSPKGVRALTQGISIHYEADGPRPSTAGRLRPSIHMPRAWSRITLEITDVRVERLQEISEADAIAEGCPNSLHLQGGRFANENYEHLWWTIHGDGSWEANPWVWCVSFRKANP